MIKSITFIILTQFFHFNELTFFKATRLLHFFKLNQQYLFTVNWLTTGVNFGFRSRFKVST